MRSVACHFSPERYLPYPGEEKPNHVTNVLAQNSIEVPLQVRVSQLQNLPSLIKNANATVEARTTETKAIKDKITVLEKEASESTAWQVAARIAGAALLVFTYAVLAATLLGIVAIVGLESADTFETVCKGPKKMQLKAENTRLVSEQAQLTQAKSNALALTAFKSRLPDHIAGLEAKVVQFKDTETKIQAMPDISDTRHYWQTALTENTDRMRNYQAVIELLKQANAA